MRKRVAILISGRGSNMAALAEAARTPLYPAEVALVVSDRTDADGLARARNFGIPVVSVDYQQFGRNRAAHEAEVLRALEAAGAEIVCLAGWMRLLTHLFIERYPGGILNIHPSLLPAFPGLHTHSRALRAGVRLHGCTVHVVTEAMDEGPILGQSAVPVLPDDTPATLAARVLRQEHVLYPAVLATVASGGLPCCAPDCATLSNPLPAWRLRA